MGWYDGNPVHLAELTPSDYAQKLVEYFGDTDAVLEKAKEDFAKIPRMKKPWKRKRKKI